MGSDADVCQGDRAKCGGSRHRWLQTVESAKWETTTETTVWQRSDRFERFAGSRKNNKTIRLRRRESIVCVLFRPVRLFFPWYPNECQQVVVRRLLDSSIGTRVPTVDRMVGMYIRIYDYIWRTYTSVRRRRSDYYCVQHVFVSVSVVSSL